MALRLLFILILAGTGAVRADSGSGLVRGFDGQGMMGEWVIPVRIGAERSENILVGKGSSEGGLLETDASSADVCGSVVRMGVLPGSAKQDIGENDNRVRVEVRTRRGIKAVLSLGDVNCWPGQETKREISWFFLGLSTENGGVIISAKPTTNALIVPNETPVSEAVSLRTDLMGVLDERDEFLLVIRPVGDVKTVVQLDRFGRLWVGDRAMEWEGASSLVEDVLRRTPGTEIVLIHDPYALDRDVDRIEALLADAGAGSDQVRTVVARADMGLEALIIPAHRGHLQREVISEEITESIPPYPSILTQQKTLIDQMRSGLGVYLRQWERLRVRISEFQSEYRTLTTQKSK